jgi:hypothetical protein
MQANLMANRGDSTTQARQDDLSPIHLQVPQGDLTTIHLQVPQGDLTIHVHVQLGDDDYSDYYY